MVCIPTSLALVAVAVNIAPSVAVPATGDQGYQM
jgi:hypothetical protein